jgi:hypothetical protein
MPQATCLEDIAAIDLGFRWARRCANPSGSPRPNPQVANQLYWEKNIWRVITWYLITAIIRLYNMSIIVCLCCVCVRVHINVTAPTY